MRARPAAPVRPAGRSIVPGLVLLFLGLSAGAALAAPAPADLALERRTLATRSGKRIEAVAGTLRVPERRGAPGSRTIEVRFLRLESRAATPRPPLFYLSGGPGNRGVSDQPGSLEFWSPFLDVSDVVLIDQRGTNDPDLVWNWDGPLPLSYFTHADSARRQQEAMARRARDVFRQRGVDLSGYTTVESAADLEDLRAALGADRISLLAFSYGTHLAAAYLRRHGDRVADAVMIGTEGPDQTVKLPWSMDTHLRRLALRVARDSTVGRQVPDLAALHERVAARLEREPVLVPLELPDGGRISLPVGRFGLDLVLRADIGDASDLVVFPRLLWSLDQGDPSVLAWFVQKRAGGAIGVHGMNQAMDAASGASAARQAQVAEQARTSRFADVVNFPPAPAGWDVPDLGDGFRAPLVAAARALFISGELDFNAPPYQAEEMRWGMANSTHLVVADAGHEQTFFQNETAIPVIVDFLAGNDVSGRRITYRPLRFVPLAGTDPAAGHPAAR